MSISVNNEGRHRSVRTKEDQRQELHDRWQSMTPEEKQLVFSILDEFDYLSKQGAHGFESIEEIEHYSPLYHALAEDHYEDQIVPIQDFILDEYYMGKSGQYLYAHSWFKDLEELDAGHYNEVIVTGSIGGGKTTFVDMGLARDFYELCMMRDPQEAFGLMPDSEIVLVCYNRDQKLARDVTFGGLKRLIMSSPFFRSLGLKEGTSELVYPKKNIRIIAVSVRSSDALGRNVYGGIIDESDFLEGSTLRGSGLSAPGEKGFAELLHDSILGRMKTRYVESGVLPGKLYMSSSARHEQSFTNRRIAAVRDDPYAFVRDYAIYEAKPPHKFKKKRFWVLVGNDRIRHKILTNKEYAAFSKEDKVELQEAGCRFLHVPEDFQSDFERNIEKAVQDIGGVVTAPMSRYIQLRDRIQDAVDPTLFHPMASPTWVTNEKAAIEWSRLVERVSVRLGPGRHEDIVRPRRHPDAVRHVHVDLSKGIQDPAGLCIAHVVDVIEVERRNREGNATIEEAPIIEVDLLLQILPPVGGEIDFGAIRGLIYDFRDFGYNIQHASFDTWQSVDSIRILNEQGIKADVVSTWKTTAPYDTLKTAIYEGRFSCYEYPILTQELEQLIFDAARQKIDHPTGGCFIGNTRIPLLDGSIPMIEELNGKEVWVYSATQNGEIVPGRAKGRMTKLTTEFVDVVLDSGAVERCTPEHRWMLRDGSYREAKDLKPGIDRLMPINRHWPVNGGYERLTDRGGKRELTHHMVMVAMGAELGKDDIVHHLDGNKINNVPENLSVSQRDAHSKRHACSRHAEDLVYRRKVLNGIQSFNLSDEGRRKHSEALSRLNNKTTREERVERAKKNPFFRSDITFARVEEARGESTANAAARRLGCGRNVVLRVLREHGFGTWQDFADSGPGLNHKVRDVIRVVLDKPVPVYDLEVDRYHNFALSSGVFVHNSKDVSDSVAGAVYTLTTKLSYRSPIMVGISEYEDRSRDDEWIRQTMKRSGDKAPIPEGGSGSGSSGPIIFSG